MSTTVNSSTPASSRTPSTAANYVHAESAYSSGHHHHHHHHHEAAASQQPSTANAAKKGKQKKVPDPNEASKLIAAKISQLELDAAGEKDQEAEIGWFDPFGRTSHTDCHCHECLNYASKVMRIASPTCHNCLLLKEIGKRFDNGEVPCRPIFRFLLPLCHGTVVLAFLSLANMNEGITNNFGKQNERSRRLIVN